MALTGSRIREIRRLRKLTQSDIAERLGVARPTVTNWETGNREPDIDTLIALANLLGTTIEYLSGRSDDPQLSDSPDPILPAATRKLEERMRVILQAFPDLNPRFLELSDEKKLEMIEKWERFIEFEVQDMMREDPPKKS